MSTPVDPSLYCAFSAAYPEDDWISAVHIVNQRAEVLLDVSYPAYAPDGYRDATADIIEAAPGDVLTISVTVNAGSTSWEQYLSWGHAIELAELTKVADLHGADGCPWTHTFDFTVPDAATGAYLISFWEYYYDYGEGCGAQDDYAERVDFTLWIDAGPPEVPALAVAYEVFAPGFAASYPASAAAPRVVQKIYAVILRADGLDDFEVPASSVLLRLRDTSASYIRAVIPDPTRWTTEILARTDGSMHIYAGTIDETGERALTDELIYANIQDVYFDLGTGNTLTLAGTRYATNSTPTSRRLDHVSLVAKDTEDYHTVTAAFAPDLRPGDTVLIDGASFLAELITATILVNDAHMVVEGGAL